MNYVYCATLCNHKCVASYCEIRKWTRESFCDIQSVRVICSVNIAGDVRDTYRSSIMGLLRKLGLVHSSLESFSVLQGFSHF